MAAVDESVAEDAALTGTLIANDVDDGAVLTFALINPAPAGFSLVGANWSFDASNLAYQHLAVGDSDVLTIDYKVIDDQGAEDLDSFTITITGTNDGPVAVADVAASLENDVLTVDVLANDTDVDLSDTHTLDAVTYIHPLQADLDQATADVSAGGLTLVELQNLANLIGVLTAEIAASTATVNIVNNELVFDPGTDFDYLASGEITDVTVLYDMSDNNGGTDNSTVTITITGTNDAPTAAVLLDQVASEDDVVDANGAALVHSILIADILSSVTDIDNTTGFDIVNASAAGLTIAKSLDGLSLEVTVDNPAAVDILSNGETLVSTITVDVTDPDGGVLSGQNFDITINGVDDGSINLILGTLGDDDGISNPIIIGTEGADQIHALPGNDIIFGLGGSDIIFGSEGDDRINGGSNLTLIELMIVSAIIGTDSALYNDLASKNYAPGTLFGDVLFGGDGTDTSVYDNPISEYSFEFVQAYEDISLTIESTGKGFLNIAHNGVADEGVDNLAVINGVLDIEILEFAGDSYNLTLGTDLAESLLGILGNDVILGLGGNDILYGDINTNSGILTAAGNDFVDGGAGNDFLFGDVFNNSGTLTTAGDDILRGGAGNDELYGDVVINSGTLTTAGNDFLDGGAGNDALIGDVANNSGTITNYGSDTFFFDVNESIGMDIIRDLNAGGVEDILSFAGIGDVNGDLVLDAADVDAFGATVTDDGTDVTISFSASDSITIENLGTGSITSMVDIEALTVDATVVVV